MEDQFPPVLCYNFQKMIRHILLYSILFATFYANAQNFEIMEEVHNRNLSVQYGHIYSYLETKISDENAVFTEPELGHEFSVLYERIFNQFFSIQSGLQYQSVNFKLGPDRKSLYEVQLEKIIVPLVFTLNSDLCKQVNFSLFSGPVIGATVNSSLNSLSVDDINRDTAITVISVKKADFGIMYGAAMEIGIDKFQVVKFLIGGRGTYGFSDINNDEDMGSNQLNIVPENSTIKTFGGFIGFKFAINGLYEYRHTSD